MNVNTNRGISRAYISTDITDLSADELAKIQIGLRDYYYKLKERQVISEADIVAEMLVKFDIYVK